MESDKSVVEKLGLKDGVLLYFVTSRKELERVFPKFKRMLPQNGSLWVGWPKRASGIEIDLNENVIREVGLKHGLVDVKVISINEQWSGLKFVYRLKDRK